MATIDSLADTQSGTSCLDSVYNDLVEINAELAAHVVTYNSHAHTAGNTIILSIVASSAALGTGATDGELKVTSDNNMIYAWDSTTSAWNPINGNVFRNQLFS